MREKESLCNTFCENTVQTWFNATLKMLRKRCKHWDMLVWPKDSRTFGHRFCFCFCFVLFLFFPYAASSGLNSLPRGIRHFQSTIAFKCVCVGGGGEGAVGGCVRARVCVGGGRG